MNSYHLVSDTSRYPNSAICNSRLCSTLLPADPADPADPTEPAEATMTRSQPTHILHHLLGYFPHVHFPRNLLSFPFTAC